MNDPIADMLTRIRNAIGANRQSVELPHSNAKEAVAKLLKANRYIHDVSVENAAVGKTLHIVINEPLGTTKITEIARMSRPGRRQYATAEEIPTVMRGRGVVIVSTSRGMMTGKEAKQQNLGGELICKVY